MNKPLSEWTAKEIVEECDRHVCCSSECRCYNSERKKCRLKPFPPPCWNLSEPPRWTEQEVERVKAIKLIYPNAKSITKYALNTLLSNEKGIFAALSNSLFPSLELYASIALDEIIGGGE